MRTTRWLPRKRDAANSRLDAVRRALAAPDDEITAEQLAVLRAAAEQGLAQEMALEHAVAELRAFAAERGVSIPPTA